MIHDNCPICNKQLIIKTNGKVVCELSEKNHYLINYYKNKVRFLVIKQFLSKKSFNELNYSFRFNSIHIQINKKNGKVIKQINFPKINIDFFSTNIDKLIEIYKELYMFQ